MTHVNVSQNNHIFRYISLLQASLSQIDIRDGALKEEAKEMMRLAERLSKCLIEYFIAKQFGNSQFKALLSSHRLAKCFQMNTWNFKQLQEGGFPKYKMTIEFVSIDSFVISVERNKRNNSDEDDVKPLLALIVGDNENNLILYPEDM